MKNDGVNNIDKKNIEKIVKMTDDELDAIFYHSIDSDSLGFGSVNVKDSIQGIKYFLQKNDDKIKKVVCHNEIVSKYFLTSEITRADLLVKIASLLGVWLPPMAAIAAAEGLLRVGLRLYCKEELKDL